MAHWHHADNTVKMNLIICGILTIAAILYCVLFDETLAFNMMMCVFCLLAIISLWSGNSAEQEPADRNKDNGQTSPGTEEIKEE